LDKGRSLRLSEHCIFFWVKCIIDTGGFALYQKGTWALKRDKTDTFFFFINDKTDTYTFQVYQFDIFIHLWFKNLTKFLPVYKNQSKTKNMLPHVQNATSA
jgi:hypothetical protein